MNTDTIEAQTQQAQESSRRQALEQYLSDLGELADRKYEIEHRPGGRIPNEYEVISFGDIARRKSSGQLTGFEYITKQPDGILSGNVTVDQLLNLGTNGFLRAPTPVSQPKHRAVTKADVETALQRALGSAEEVVKYKNLFTTVPKATVQKGQKWVESPCDELHRLETSGDLSDPRIANRIGELRAMADTIPHRTQLAQQAHGRDLNELSKVSNLFISETLSPRVKDIATRSQALVRTKIRDHVLPDELDFCVDRSFVMVELRPIQQTASVRTFNQDDALTLAREVLAASDAADVFEKKHLTA